MFRLTIKISLYIFATTFFINVSCYSDLRCYVCTDCEYDYEDTKMVCEDIRPTTVPPDEQTTPTEELDTTTSIGDSTTSESFDPDESSSSSSDSITSSYSEDKSTSTMKPDAPWTSSTEPTTLSTNPVDTTTPASEPTSTPSEVENFTPSSVNSDEDLSSIGENNSPTTSKEQITTTLKDVSELFTTESDATTQSTNSDTTESIGGSSLSTLPNSNEEIAQSTYSEETTLSTTTTPSEGTETTTSSSIVESSTTEESDAIITITDASVEDVEYPKSKFDVGPNVLMIDESKKYGSPYTFLRAVRAVKNDVDKKPRCVVTSYKDENRTIVVRGCSFAQEDVPEKHCNTLLDTGFTRNLSRCFVCNENLCNSASKSISSFINIVTIFLVFTIFRL